MKGGPCRFILPPSSFILASGEVQEWLNWQHWKCCERETVPWVRIPPSPPRHCRLPIFDCRGLWNRVNCVSRVALSQRNKSIWIEENRQVGNWKSAIGNLWGSYGRQ